MASKKNKPRTAKPKSLAYPSAVAHVADFLRKWKSNPLSAFDDSKRTVSKLAIDWERSGNNTTNGHEGTLSIEDKAKFVVAVALSASVIPGYATLDRNHAQQLRGIIEKINRYSADQSQTHPLNFLMIASPGAGKSHMIECIASSMHATGNAITFNMATMGQNEDLIHAIDEARNIKIRDRLPIIFFDEFDTDRSKLPLLLPLLWDGRINIGSRDLRIGRSVFFLAGSGAELPEAIKQARSLKPLESQPEDFAPKLLDLLSRINGDIVSIPKFRDREQFIDRRPDKVCIAVHLLRRRFGKSLNSVALGLLRFIALVDFRYDVRSINCLIDSIPFVEDCTKLESKLLRKLPFRSSEALQQSHLSSHFTHGEQAEGVVSLWERCFKSDEMIPISSPLLENISTISRYSPGLVEWLASEICDFVRTPTSKSTH